tara:strand:- start:84 stop:434 length:351 start_codon:yes stop_codon:yes gene_type:complete
MYKTDPLSFYVQLKPQVDDEDDWTGELEVNILYDKRSPLKSDGFLHLKHLTELVACTIAYMEENPDFYENLTEFLMSPENCEDDHSSHEETVTPEIESIEGNVVRLSFNSKTRGSA